MTPEELERRLAELGDAYADLDVGSVVDGFRERLAHMAEVDRIDELAAGAASEPIVPTEEPATDEPVVRTYDPVTDEPVVPTYDPATDEPVVRTYDPATGEPILRPYDPTTRARHETVRRPVAPPDASALPSDAPPVPQSVAAEQPTSPVRRPVAPPPLPLGDTPPVLPSVAAEPPPGPVRRLAGLLADVDVLVRVLGEVEAVRHVGPDPADRQEEKLVPVRQKGLEAITYLALRESAVDREDLEINLFPDGINAARTAYNTVSAARALVGDDLFPPPEGGRYELSERVVTDYGLFCDLVAQADATEDLPVAVDLLWDALSLVRGEPFTGVGRSYAWVGPHRGMIVAQVVDAAEELAEVQLATGAWRQAEWAARQGLRAFPSDERMYRLLMRAARAAGNVPGVQRVFRELCEVIADLDPDLGVEPEDTLHPETIALLEQLTGRAPTSDHRTA